MTAIAFRRTVLERGVELQCSVRQDVAGRLRVALELVERNQAPRLVVTFPPAALRDVAAMLSRVAAEAGLAP